MGSFGIGKYAPFANTPLRTVLYSTCYRDGSTLTRRFTGRAILTYHRRPDVDTEFGAKGYLKPANSDEVPEDEIPERFRKQRPGTSVFVPGYGAGHGSDHSDWKHAVIDQITDNFFYAVLKGRLDVIVIGETRDSQFIIDKDALDNQKIEVNSETTRRYIEICANPPVAETLIEGIGNVRLYLSVGDDEPERRSIALVRAPGLMLTNRAAHLGKDANPPIPRHWRKITAVVVCEPRAGSSAEQSSDWVIRACENPAHDRIAVDQVTQTKERTRRTARKRLRELRGWLRAEIGRLAEPAPTEADDDLAELKERGLVIADPRTAQTTKAAVSKPVFRVRAPAAQNVFLDVRGEHSEEESDDGESEAPPDAGTPKTQGKRGGGQARSSTGHKLVRRPRIDLKPVFRPLLDSAKRPDSHGLVISFRLPGEAAKAAARNGLRTVLRVVGEDENWSRIPVRSVRSRTPKVALEVVKGSLVIPVAALGHPGRIEAELRTAEPVDHAAFDLFPRLFDLSSEDGKPS